MKDVKLRKQYRAVKGSKLSDSQAKVFGKRIDWLMDQNGRSVTPEDLLMDARNAKSPLHKYFEWSDRAAAEQWRLNQARYVLRSISVDVVYADGNKKTTRAFVNVNRPIGDDEERKSVYVNIESALSDSDMGDQLLEDAVSELDSWRQRYAMLRELAIVFGAIEKVKTRLRKRHV